MLAYYHQRYCWVSSAMVSLLLLFLDLAKVNAFYKYDSSSAFLNVRSLSPEGKNVEQRFCVNYQEYRSKELPNTVENALTYTLSWWDVYNQYDVCKKNSKIFTNRELVPAYYQTNASELEKSCRNRGYNRTIAHLVGYQVNITKKANVSALLFLVDRGKQNYYGVRDYLFSQFYNPEISGSDNSLSVFYIYKDNFINEVLPFLSPPVGPYTPAQFLFYRPTTWMPFDGSVIVLWALAVFSIAVGSAWAAAEVKKDAEVQTCTSKLQLTTSVTQMEDGPGHSIDQNELQDPENTTTSTAADSTRTAILVSPKPKSDSEALAQLGTMAHCFYVLIIVIMVVAVLMLAFFFRSSAVWFFNIFLVVIGSVCVHYCAYALLMYFTNRRDFEICSFADMFFCTGPQCPVSCFARIMASDFCTSKFRFLSTLVYTGSLALCIFWFLNRTHHNVFILLDMINFCLCTYAIKSSQIRSLRLLTFLLLAMFVYDLFMVFGTRLLTTNGCSVMLQVVTGQECNNKVSNRSSTDLAYVIPPNEANIPEKLPLLFFLPMLNDPMAECFDVMVETEYKHVMLGLGDVIIPGYFIAYCFYIDTVKKSKIKAYSIISIIGYSVGMVTTFVALRLMQSGQPALIYLVPCTLIPIVCYSLYDRTLAKIWQGTL